MDVTELFTSKYLKAADATPAITVTVQRVSWEKMKDQDGNEENKPVIWFVEQEKGMVLNRTNAGTLTALFGSDVNKWIGQRAILGTEMVTAFGATKPALRFRNEDVHYDRASLNKRYAALLEQAAVLGIPHLDSFAVTDDTPDATLIELGRDLRAAIDTAKAF